MRTSKFIVILKSIIIFCCHLFEVASSFQQSPLSFHPKAFRIIYYSPNCRHQRSCLFEKRSITGRAANWNAKYKKLADFYKRHGNLRVEYNCSLDRWMRYQQQKRKGTGTGGPLTDDQIKLLDKLDFDWDPDLNKWRSKYDELADFYKEHGHLRVEYQASLYWWIQNQRRRQKGTSTAGPLSDKQIKLLDELDFDWDPKPGVKRTTVILDCCEEPGSHLA